MHDLIEEDLYDLNKDYIWFLFKQFISAKGFKQKDVLEEKEKYMDEFKNWLNDLELSGLGYTNYAYNYGISLASRNTIELNKGAFDSFVSKEHRISPFSDNTELVIYQGIPMIKSGINIVEGQVADIYHTHNPYGKEYLNGLAELQHYGYKICFGVFGRTYDKDKKEKFKLVRDYLSFMSSDLEMQYDTENDNYYLILFSKFKQKDKVLRKGLL